MSDDFFNLNGELIPKNSEFDSTQDANSSQEQNSYNQNPYSQDTWTNNSSYHNQGANGLAITAFVLSLIAPILCCCSSYGFILSAIACITSIVLAFVSKQRKPFHGLAIAALIISFIYLAILIFLLVCVIIVFSSPDMIEIYDKFYNDMYNDLYGGYEFDLFHFIKF